MASLFSQLAVAGTLGIITLGIWLHLFFGRGWFWRVKKLVADQLVEETQAEWPSVAAVIPARNEAATIAKVMASLAQQDYPGNLSITIVDDHSEDATADLAKKAASESGAENRVRILSASVLPAGWTGKLWALNEGVSKGGDSTTRTSSEEPNERPDYFWFTDADIIHAPDTLRRLVTRAGRDKLDLASLMVLLQAKSFPERALIPAFLYFFLMLYPPQWIADEDLGTAGAAGGCILVKSEALERIGGLAIIRGEVIDDCALARAVKNSGGRVWMGLTRKSASLRAYGSFSEIRDLIARTAFTQLRYSSLFLAGTLAAMFLTFVAPVMLLFVRDPTARVLGLGAWLFMTLSFIPTLRFYRLSLLWALSLPMIAIFYSLATMLSALRHWLGSGAQWKGRSQAPRGI
ncbi:MAG TPA: glycosyltransferase [Candidatus Solibacter sp.]|nr:glycosyltransferase [Candidatus Solibacter sp.]